jgi:deoxyribose-phosphate aldolase
MNSGDIAGKIDHTLLKPNATSGQIEKLCAEAAQYHFASVCVNPTWVPLCSKLLRGSGVKVCTVIGFPLGSANTESKAAEAETAVEQGADELDMVINIGKLLDGDDRYVLQDIEAVVQAARGRTVKVIVEICYLDSAQIVRACQLSKDAGAQFVKTSTGFGTGGATEEAVRLMRQTVGPRMGVKAAGGIRNRDDAIRMLSAGASRIGASAGIAIVEGG